MSSSYIFQLEAPYSPAGDQPAAIDGLIASIKRGYRYQTLLGVTGSGKTYTTANVIAQTNRPALLLAPNKTLAAQLYMEMRAFFPHNAVEYFVSYYDYYQPEAYLPASDTFYEKDSAVNTQIEQMRLSATRSLLERNDVIVVATVSAIYGLGDPIEYRRMALSLTVNQSISQREFINYLINMQYRRHPVEWSRGYCRVRGDIIDVFPAESAENALRISWDDESIVSLHWFDALTGAVIDAIDTYTIYPANHYVTHADRIKKAIITIEEELNERLEFLHGQCDYVACQRLEQRTQYDLDLLRTTGSCKGIENYSRHLSGRGAGEMPVTLLEYLPEQTLIFIDESHITIPQIRAMYRGDRSRKENLVTFGFRLPSAFDNRPLRFEEFESFTFPTVFISATPSHYEAENQQAYVEQIMRPTGLLDPEIEIHPVASQVEHLLQEIHLCIARQHRVLVTTLTKKLAERLASYMEEQGIKARYIHADVNTVERVSILQDLRSGECDVLIGINLLREGIDLPEVSLVAILDADKEGFLRSTSSLIQMLGRAARHLNGRAIFYADRITSAMKNAIDESYRRRNAQLLFNKKHGIEPKSITQRIKVFIPTDDNNSEEVCEPHPGLNDLLLLEPMELKKKIKTLEKKMKGYATRLEFEKALVCRKDLKCHQDALLLLK